MQLVASVHHPVEQPAGVVCELVVHVQVPHRGAVRHPREIQVDPVDLRHHRHVVVAREDRRHNDGGLRRLAAARVDHGPQAACDVRGLVGTAGLDADIVGAGKDHDHLGIHAVQLAVDEPPQDVLDPIGAPPEVRGIPSVEAGAPVGQQFRIIGGSPSPRDRVADEVDVDATVRPLLEQLRVREP